MRKFYFLSTIVLTILFGGMSYAQDFSNKGKDFWVGYGFHVSMGLNGVNTGGNYQMVLYFATDSATTVTVTCPGNGYTATYNIPANTIFATNPLPKSGAQDCRLFSEGTVNKGVHVVATKPVVAYAHIYDQSISGATLLLPTNTLGKEYYSINFEQRSNSNNANCFFYVIACDTGITRVEITPSAATIGGWVANTTYTVSLTQGEVYNVMGTVTGNNGVDLTGSKIRSVSSATGGCKRIAVFSGAGKLSIKCPNTGGGATSDNYMVQAFPKNAWGKKFLTVPTLQYPNNYFRICVSDPTTVVRVNGVVLGGLINNFYYQIQNTTPNLIEANMPISVAQYTPSQGQCGGAGNGDPEMIYLSSVEQNINKVILNSASQFLITNHYLNVVLPNSAGAINTFRIDGAVPSSPFVVHPQAPNFVTLQQPVSAGQHIVQSDTAFNIIAYGYGNFESYGYNGGTNVRDLTQGIVLETQYGIDSFSSICTYAPFKFKLYYPDSTTATPPVQIRFDSIRWDLSNRSMITPNNFPITQINPTIDSTNIRGGRQVNWYSIPGFYFFNTPGIDTLLFTTYRSTNEGCGTEQLYEFPIQIADPPAGDYTWTTNGCVTQPVQFIETTNQAPKPTYRYWWDFGDPASGPLNNSTIRNPAHLFSTAGTYSVRYTAITTPGCLLDTITKIITLDYPPVADFSAAAPLCINVPVQFTDLSTASPGDTINVWAWDFGDGGTSTLQNPTHTYLAAGTYNVTLQVFTTTSCPSQIDTLVVTIAPDGTISLTSAPGTDNQTVCNNSPITDITYSVSGSGTGAAVVFTPLLPGVTGVYSAGVFTISGTPASAGTFTYTVSTTGPCVIPQASGTITVNPLPTASISGTTAVCVNAPSPIITFTGAGATAPYTFTYNINGGPNLLIVSAGNTATIAVSTAIAGTFTYNLLSVQDASGTLCSQAQTGSATVTVNPLPTAIISGTTAVCLNTPAPTITFTGAGATAPYTFTYNINGGPNLIIVSVGNTATIVVSTAVAGIFTYNLLSVQDASGTLCNQPQTGLATVTVNPLPTATINGSSQVCLNDATPIITFTGAGATAPYTFTFNINGGPNQLVVSVGNIATIAAPTNVAGTFVYNLLSVQDASSTTCSQAQTGSATVIVYPLPTAIFTFTIPSCETRTICFTDISVANTGSIVSWAWDFGDGNTSTNQNPCHSFATAGTYNVTLVVTTNNGCVSINPAQQVVINARPLAGYIVPEVCLSDTYAQFTDTSKVTTPDNIVAWDWNFGDPPSGGANTSTLQNPQHSYTATGLYTVQLIVTSNRGCKDTVSHILQVNGSFPVADFTVINPTTLCANDSVSIAEASTVFPGVITKVEIYWDNVGSPAVFDIDNSPLTGKIYKHLYPNFQVPLTRTFTIRYRAYSGGVCVNDKLRNITVNAAPLVQFNNMPNICYDAAPYQITPAIASETGGVPGSGIFTGPGVSLTGLFSPVVAGPGTHRLLYTFTSTAGGCIDTASNTITVWDTAFAKIDVQPLACEKNAISFTSTNSTIAPGNGSITGWNWNFGDPGSGAANTSTLQNPSHLFTGWGNYNVTLSVTTSNGCRSTVRTLPVFVNPEPKPNFSTPPSSCLPNASVAFTNSTTIADGTQASFTYLWNFGDPGSGVNNTSTLANPSHTYTSTGPFNVSLQVTSGVGCVNSISIPLTTVHPQPLASFTTDKIDVCIGSDIVFTNTSNPLDGTITQYNWLMDDGNVRNIPTFAYRYSSIGSYNVSLFIFNNHGCRSTTANKTVFVNPYPPANAGPDKFMLQGGQVMLTPVLTANMPVTYLWIPAQYLSDPTISNPIATPPDDKYYTFQVTTDKGCSATDQVFIKVLKLPAIPNIFSPNGDGIHDTWVIQYLESYPGCTVDIFNRYGQKIFESKGYTKPWDGTINGKPVPIGTYYYIVNPKNGRKLMSGYVDVIR